MVYFMENPSKIDHDWWYLHFRKPPRVEPWTWDEKIIKFGQQDRFHHQKIQVNPSNLLPLGINSTPGAAGRMCWIYLFWEGNFFAAAAESRGSVPKRAGIAAIDLLINNRNISKIGLDTNLFNIFGTPRMGNYGYNLTTSHAWEF